ncbi:head maturation protease, ClpP-related [Photobacterium indicum]|nr:head maturation protease, ClpP-related [Photobacterium indicum]
MESSLMPMPKNTYFQMLFENRHVADRKFAIESAEGSDDAEIFLYDAIVSDKDEAEWWGGVDPETFVNAVRGIDAKNIHLRINSPGGSVFAARTMEQALREHKATVTVHIDGLAASAASFLAMAGDEIIIGEGAMMMIHKAWTVSWGNADDLLAEAALLEKLDGTLAKTYAKRAGGDEKTFSDYMRNETWFTADEAVAAGIADTVYDAEPAPKKEGSTNNAIRPNWNCNAFLNAVNRPDTQEYVSDEHRDRQMQRLNVLTRCALAVN